MELLAGHTNSYHTYDQEEALAGIASAGFRYVELSAVPGWTEHLILEEKPEAVRRLLDSCGLEAVSISAHSDLTTSDGLEHGVRAIRWASDYGLGIVNTAVGGHASQEEDERAFLENVGVLADAAEGAGVLIALEIHGALMASGEKSLPLLEKIGRDSIKLNYDTANVEYYSGTRAIDDLPKIVAHVVHCHLKDTMGGIGNWDCPPLGEGKVDFPRVLEILREAGYDGPLSVEIEFQGEPWPPLHVVDSAMATSYEYLLMLTSSE